MIVYIVITLFFSAIVLGLIRQRKMGDHTPLFSWDGWVILIFSAALFIRIFPGLFAVGHESDMNTFKAWGHSLYELGFQQIYQQNMFLDYPPGYLYVLYFIEHLRRVFSLDFNSPLFNLIMKSPSILADLFCGAVLLWYARRKLSTGGAPGGDSLASNASSDSMALFATGIYLLCPAVFINSSIWGQIDSFCVSFLVVSVLLMSQNRFLLSAVIYGVSIALKPQMLVFAPLYIFYAVRKKKYKMLLISVLMTILVVLLLATPYTQNFNYRWILEKYLNTMGSYNYFSVNAYNLWALLGLNFAELPTGIAGILLNFAGPVLATTLCGIFMLRSKREDALFACPVILMSVVYFFTVKMHERYLFHILIFILLCYLSTKDMRLIYAFTVVSALHMINVSYMMVIYQVLGENYDPNEPTVKLISALQLAAFFYLMYVLIEIYLRDRIVTVPMWEKNPLVLEKPIGSSMKRCDFLIVLIITGLYSILAFWNLGAHETALTSWTPAQGEEVVLKTDTPVNTLCYLPGIAPDRDHYRALTGTNVMIESSDDGIKWEDAKPLNEGESNVFQWTLQYFDKPASYIRITAIDGFVCINEIGFRDALSHTYTAVTLLSEHGKALFDETSVVPVKPSFYYSTYFDEIYHARTAYEHILGLEPYESTHPPLGKLLISLGIRLFGMNPFGWRFIGSLIGVLMLPCLYHLLKRLFGNSFLCTAGTLLFAFDFMHFSQTRISTIDSYAVFFILLMYDSMVVFLQKDLHKSRLRDIMPPLICSGVFMGLGIASKWTVVYGALGLAILFFVKVIHAYRNCDKDELRTQLMGKILHLCGWCCLWFIAIPFLIYFAAFLPITTLSDNQIFSSFLERQVSMFSYHSALADTHPYQSPWYEWPFIIKPTWYYYSENPWHSQQVQSISALGNPALWWPGIPAMISATVLLVNRKSRNALHSALVAVVGFLSVYLPWVLISRITFIYHYFTAIPFLIISIVLVLEHIKTFSFAERQVTIRVIKKSVSWFHVGVCLYLLLNAALFLVFFPALSGLEVSREYIKNLQWLPGWNFLG